MQLPVSCRPKPRTLHHYDFSLTYPALMTPSQLQSLVIPVLTLLLGGLVASVVSAHLTIRHQRTESLRTKLEAAYEATHHYCNSLGGFFLRSYPLFKGDISVDQDNDLMIANSSDRDATAYLRLELLVAMYAPSAGEDFADLLKCREAVGELRSDYKRGYVRGEAVRLDLIAPLNERTKQLDQIEKAMKQSIVRAVQRL